MSFLASFILGCVTTSSPASKFTATTASSVDHRSIAHSLLRNLGLKVSLLHRPRSDGHSSGNRSNLVVTYPPSLPCRFYERTLDFGKLCYLVHLPGLKKRFTCVWAITLTTAFFRSRIGTRSHLFPFRLQTQCFFGHPCFRLLIPSFWAETSLVTG